MTFDKLINEQQATQTRAAAAAAVQSHDLAASATLSLRDEMAGSILITGALGFLGSVVLESLLRNCPQTKTVYLLVRGKKTLTAQQRVERLLCDPLFNQLHTQVAEAGSSDSSSSGSNPFRKVVAVQGDLCLHDLGLSQDDKQLLLQRVTHVIHCAASIELDACIKYTLRHNYLGTQGLMQLSAQMHQLRSFVHVSTFFVANHMPRNSVVREQLHPLPLQLDGRPVEHAEFVAALMAMEDADEANRVALQVMADSNFNSTYAFGKSLTEQLVVDTPLKPGVQRAIVRPSLIAGLLGDPYPGYISGYGGPSGYAMGYALGFFSSSFSVAFGSCYLMDFIPADVVAGVTIAAAAKASAVAGTAPADEQVPIYHACSAHCHPVSLATVFDCSSRFWSSNPPPWTLPGTRYVKLEREHHPTEWGVALGRCISWCKILACCALLKAFGQQRKATLLKNAYTAFSVYNTQRYNRSIRCAVDNVIALRSELSPEERKLWTLVADASVLSWYSYGYTVFAGVRRLLFRQPGDIVGAEGHNFMYKGPGVSPDALGLSVDADADAEDVVEPQPSTSDNTADTAAAAAESTPTAWAVVNLVSTQHSAAQHNKQAAAVEVESQTGCFSTPAPGELVGLQLQAVEA